MRILAIRGQNLASLYGPFEVDLASGPISGAGLFAICGPTGSGKSTILDALCLALFGRTPRLGGHGGNPIGRPDEDEKDRVLANDARALISRGTALAVAEADFRGVDGRRYRARWSVRRARARAGGRLQPQEMTLQDLASGEAIGEGLATTRSAIEERLGFGFDEFRRAVVLPQLEFTAFLKAGEGERGAILQRTTGTELYDAISMAAHARAAAETRALEALEAEAGREVPLEETARDELERAVEAERERIRSAVQAGRAAEEALRWHARAGELRSAAQAASAELERIQSEAHGQAGLRVDLAQHERASAHRGELELAREAAGALDVRARDADVAGEELARAEAALARALQGAGRARECREEAEEASRSAAPELELARALDAEVEIANRAARTAQDEAEQAARAAKEALAAKEAVREDAACLSSERAEVRAWLADHATQAPLAEGWDRWEKELVRHAGAERELVRAGVVLDGTEREALRARGDEERARQEVAAAARVEASAAEALAQARTRAAELDAPACAAERERLQEGVTRLRDLVQAGREARLAAEAVARCAGLTAAAREAEATAEAEVKGLEAGRVEAGRALDLARDHHDRARAALSLEARRRELVAGEHCPLCGACEHPWAGGSPLAGLESELAGQLRLHEEEVAQLVRTTGEASRAAAVARAQASLSEEHGREGKKALAAARERWTRTCQAAGASLPEDALHGCDAAPRALASALDALDTVCAREREANGRERLAREAAAQLEGLQARAAEAARTLGNAVRAADQAGHEVELARQERAARLADRNALESALGELLAPWGGWRERLRERDAPFRRALAASVALNRRQRSAAEGLDTRCAELGAALGVARARGEERSATAVERGAAAELSAGRAAELTTRRAAKLGGRLTGEVEAELREGVRRALAAVESAQVELGAARVAEAAWRADEARCAKALEEARASALRADCTLEASLAVLGWDREELSRRLDRPVGWAEQARAVLGELERRSAACAGALEARLAQAKVHAGGAPDLSFEAAKSARGEAHAEESAARDAHAGVDALLRDDARKRERLAALGPRRAEAAKRARTWALLGEVIGSSDGKKLRTFAQSLTLDALLASANRHLRDLAPRYRFMRVPQTDLDLQIVDGDLGDEVRSVNSLSGGEAFLASLALALGLASLSTRTRGVETLFIDEGFGTLDRDSLDKAMVALEGLPALGRTVGIISHVPELQERLPVQVRVEPIGTGRSRVITVGA